jgi:hypothetical protein
MKVLIMYFSPPYSYLGQNILSSPLKPELCLSLWWEDLTKSIVVLCIIGPCSSEGGY